MSQSAATPRWVAIQRNPRSGSGARRGMLLELIRTLREQGLRPRVFRERPKLTRWLDDPQHRAGLVCLVAAGGDGTVADLFNRFPGVRIAILPAGTENLLARHLQIPPSGRIVATMIAQGRTRKLDLCLLASQSGAGFVEEARLFEKAGLLERRFALMASAGFDADVIHRLHATRTGNISRATYLKPILESLRRYEYPPLRIWLDNDAAPLAARLAMAVNVPVYALGLRVAGAAREDDGTLDLRLFQHGSAFQMARYFCKVARGTHERLADVTSTRATRVRIESDVPVPLQVDGDPAGWTPAEIRVLPAALDVYVP